MNNIFYVYIYLDPRKPESFDYGEFHFDFEPFYVGKGKKNQWLSHLWIANNPLCKEYRLNKIRKIQSLGLEPIIIKYKENLTEQEAFDLEKKIIENIGRLDLRTGPLTNLSDGGRGGISNPSQETRKRLSESHVGKTKDTHPGVARGAEKMRGRFPWNKGRTKENDSRIARAAERLIGRFPWNKGKTKENDLSVARQAEKIRGRTKENDPGVARAAEKKTGRTKENNLGRARQAEKMKGNKYAKKETVEGNLD